MTERRAAAAPLALFGAVLVIGILTTSIAVGAIGSARSKSERAHFDRAAVSEADRLARAVDRYSQALSSAARYLSLSAPVSTATFLEWGRNGMLAHYPGLHSITFVSYVRADDVEAFVSSRRSADPSFRFTTENPAARDFFVATASTPTPTYIAGRDLGSPPIRRAAFERARDTGQPAVTEGFTLIVDEALPAGDRQNAFAIYAPVYTAGADITTVEARRRALVGWTAAPVLGIDLLSAIGVGHDSIGLAVFDEDGVDLSSYLGVSVAPASGMVAIVPIRVGGREWTVRAFARPGFAVASPSLLWVVLGGLMVSLLGAVVVAQLFINGRRKKSDLSRALSRAGGAEQRFAASFDRSEVLSALLDGDRNIISINDSMLTVLGRSRDELIGGPGGSIVKADHRHEIATAISRLSQDPFAAAPFKVAIESDDGERWLRGTLSMFRDAEGEESILLQAEDVTAAVHADNELRTSEAVRRASLDALDEGVALCDLTGKVLFINGAGTAIVGYSGDELTEMFQSGKWVTYHEDGSVLPPAERPLHRTLFEGEPVTDAVVGWKTRDGRILTLSCSSRAVVDDEGHRSGAVVAFRDITLERSEQRHQKVLADRFRGAFTDAPVGVLIVSSGDGTIIEANAHFAELVGSTGAAIVGKRLAEVLRTSGDGDLFGRVVRGVRDGRDSTPTTIRIKGGTSSQRIVTVQAASRSHDDSDEVVVHVEDVTDKFMKDAAIAAAEEELRRSFENAAYGMAVVASDGTFRRANTALCQFLGRQAPELLGRRASEFIFEEDREETTRRARDAVRTGRPVQCECRWLRPDGSVVWGRISVAVIKDETGAAHQFVTQVEDITEARLAAEALRASQARFSALIERSSDIICLLSAEGQIVYASPAAERTLGYAQSADGTHFADLLHGDDAPAVVSQFQALLLEPGAVLSLEARIRTVDGNWRHIEVVATNRLNDPDVRGVVANVRDITERAVAAARLRWQAYHDPLTGLPNRAFLLREVDEAIDRSRMDNTRAALLFVDLDRFKLVNDTMGHAAGDELLVEAARRISEAVRTTDLVARFGGDEFVIVAPGLVEPEEAHVIASRVSRSFVPPIELAGGHVAISASIGIAFDTTGDSTTLLREADDALYRAKAKGKNRAEAFDETMRAEVLRRTTAEALLHRALDNSDGITLHYQPIVDLNTGSVVAAEALLRVAAFDGRVDLPDEFVAIAEDTGLIVVIGAGVIDEACRQLRAWRDGGIEAHLVPRQISINVSGKQLSNPGFADIVAGALETHGLVPADLILELTESNLITADHITVTALQALHDLGVSLAIDDFGTGHSSLAYLKRLPADLLKLDRGFVDGLGIDPSDTEIARAVIALGRNLGLTTIAEGIETPEQLEQLRELGCDCGQGYLLARPTPADSYAGVTAAFLNR